MVAYGMGVTERTGKTPKKMIYESDNSSHSCTFALLFLDSVFC